jgi:SET family sugar efflux transporter-like MFS transporter
MAVDVAPRGRRFGRVLLPIGLVCLAVGMSSAMVVPFLSLFLSTAVHASPAQVTVFLIVAPLASVVVSTLIGQLSDRRNNRRALLIAASIAGLISTGLTTFVRDYRTLLALTVTATALATAAFPQAFAYARQALGRDPTSRAALGISSLRTVWSLAWVAGPAVAALLLNVGGFAYVFGAGAVTYAVAGVMAIFWLKKTDSSMIPAASSDDASNLVVPDALEASRWTLLLTAGGFTMLQCPLTLAVQALPMFISTDLGGNVADAGFILGLCAALEIPLMLGLGALTTRVPVRVLVLAGAGCGVAYYALVAATSRVWLLAAAQILDAAFIAAVSGLAISYVQDMLPRHPGRATTLFTNAFPIGAMMAGPLFGLAQHYGYRLAYSISTALCASGLLVLIMARPHVESMESPRHQRRGRHIADELAAN